MSTSRTVSVSLIWLSSLSGPLLLSREISRRASFTLPSNFPSIMSLAKMRVVCCSALPIVEVTLFWCSAGVLTGSPSMPMVRSLHQSRNKVPLLPFL